MERKGLYQYRGNWKSWSGCGKTLETVKNASWQGKIQKECRTRQHYSLLTANEHNKYFATIGTKIQEELNFKRPLKPIPNKKRSELPEFVFKNENATKIKKIIENIKTNVAIGCDNIGIRIINDLKEIMAPILANIINIGYESPRFPDCMKGGVIKPIYKREDRKYIENYRPITVLPTLSKVFERSAEGPNHWIPWIPRTHQQKTTCVQKRTLLQHMSNGIN